MGSFALRCTCPNPWPTLRPTPTLAEAPPNDSQAATALAPEGDTNEVMSTQKPRELPDEDMEQLTPATEI